MVGKQLVLVVKVLNAKEVGKHKILRNFSKARITVWKNLVTDQSECPCPLTLSTIKSSYNGPISMGPKPWCSRKRLPCPISPILLIHRQPGGHISGGRDGIRIHYGENASQGRQCDALGSGLLGNFAFHVDITVAWPPTSTSLKTSLYTPLLPQFTLMTVASFRRIMHPARLQIVQELF